MTRHSAHVRAVLQRENPAAWSETDPLAATLGQYWAEGCPPESPLARFAETGEISDATVAALRRDLALLESAADARQTGAWVAQKVVGCLLAYAELHLPRPAVPGWADLRTQTAVARLFAGPAPAAPPHDLDLHEALGAATGLPSDQAVGIAVAALFGRLSADPALAGASRPPLASEDLRAVLSEALGGPERHHSRRVLQHAVEVLDSLGVTYTASGTCSPISSPSSSR